MDRDTKKPFTLSIWMILCLLFRLLPFRPANIEPLLSVQMPFSKVYGPLGAFVFGSFSIFVFDVITHKIGIWTLFTMISYGLLGVGSHYYFKKFSLKTSNYVRFAILGTLLYDAFTGLTIGPIFFHQNFMHAIIGQIPFTLLHLVGNITFAATLSPVIYHLFVRKREQNLVPSLLLNYKKYEI
jgi:uncharacterized membrane protein